MNNNNNILHPLKKRDARAHYKAALLKQNFAQISQRISTLIKEADVWKTAQSIVSFNSLGDEPNLDKLVDSKAHNGASVHFAMRDNIDDLLVQLNYIDLILIPGLAFSKDGWRLGRGGGYYDKLLNSINFRNVFKLGVIPNELLFEAPPWEIDKWDIPVNSVITEEGLFTCLK